MRKVDYIKDIVNKYSTEEIVAWLSSYSATIYDRICSSKDYPNPNFVIESIPEIGQLSKVLKALDEKINGKSIKSVL